MMLAPTVIAKRLPRQQQQSQNRRCYESCTRETNFRKLHTENAADLAESRRLNQVYQVRAERACCWRAGARYSTLASAFVLREPCDTKRNRHVMPQRQALVSILWVSHTRQYAYMCKQQCLGFSRFSPAKRRDNSRSRQLVRERLLGSCAPRTCSKTRAERARSSIVRARAEVGNHAVDPGTRRFHAALRDIHDYGERYKMMMNREHGACTDALPRGAPTSRRSPATFGIPRDEANICSGMGAAVLCTTYHPTICSRHGKFDAIEFIVDARGQCMMHG